MPQLAEADGQGQVKACMLCRSCPGDKLRLECPALQGLHEYMLALFQDVLSQRCIMWQEKLVLVSKALHTAM